MQGANDLADNLSSDLVSRIILILTLFRTRSNITSCILNDDQISKEYVNKNDFVESI